MFFNLDNLPIIKNKIFKKNHNSFSFNFNGKKYYFKYHKNIDNFYNELIAEKIANHLNIPCCHYYLAYYLDDYGVVSEYIENPKYINMFDYLAKKYSKEECDYRNTLEDIWDAFYIDFNEKTTKRLMDELINIFIFDCLIGNFDRHNENFGLILDLENTHFAPLFDNEMMLSSWALEDGIYSLKIEKYLPENNYSSNEINNLLYQFLDYSDASFQTQLIEKLHIISEESIEMIFKELEHDEIIIEEPIKRKILDKFARN